MGSVALALGAAAALAFRVGGTPAGAQRAEARRSAVPQWAERVLAWDESLVADVGAVCAGSIAEHTFTFTNQGPDVLQISETTTSCSCTAVSAVPYRVGPHGAVTVTVRVQTSNRLSSEESMQEEAAVFFAGHAEPVRVALKGLVYREFPLAVDFGRLAPDETAEKRFLVRSCDGRELQIRSVETSDDRVTAEVGEGPYGAAIPVLVRLTPRDLVGDFTASLRFRLERTQEPDVRVTVRAYVTPAVEVCPEAFSLGVLGSDRVGQGTVELRSTDGAGFEITEATSDLPNSDVAWCCIDNQRQRYALTIRLSGAEAPGSFADRVVVRTTHPRADQIIIPVYGVCRPSQD
jgi:hypothetical protein